MKIVEQKKKHLIRGASVAALAVTTMLFCSGCQGIGMPRKAAEKAFLMGG